MFTDSIEEAKRRLEQNADEFKDDLELAAKYICPFPYVIALDLAQNLGIGNAFEEKDRMSLEMAATRVSSDLQTVDGLFRLLEHMGLARIHNEEDTVSLTDQGRRVLTPGESSELVDVYLHLYRLFRSQLGALGSTKDGGGTSPRLTWPPQNPDHSRNFEKYMATLSPYIAVWLDEILDWSGVRDLLDVGGGDGTIVGALCRKHRDLKARVLNLPAAGAAFDDKMKRYGVTEQVRFVGADFLSDPLPSGSDVILFSRMLCDWGDDVVVRLLDQCGGALNPGGVVCICEIVHRDDRPWDGDPWFFLWKTLVPGYWQYGSRPIDEWERILGQCGLKITQLKMSPYPLLGRLFVMIAEPVKK